MKKAILCSTIETDIFYPDIVKNASKTQDRAQAMRTYVTYESLMKFNLTEMVNLIRICSPV